MSLSQRNLFKLWGLYDIFTYPALGVFPCMTEHTGKPDQAKVQAEIFQNEIEYYRGDAVFVTGMTPVPILPVGAFSFVCRTNNLCLINSYQQPVALLPMGSVP
jgi:hypothetical protein